MNNKEIVNNAILKPAVDKTIAPIMKRFINGTFSVSFDLDEFSPQVIRKWITNIGVYIPSKYASTAVGSIATRDSYSYPSKKQPDIVYKSDWDFDIIRRLKKSVVVSKNGSFIYYKQDVIRAASGNDDGEINNLIVVNGPFARRDVDTLIKYNQDYVLKFRKKHDCNRSSKFTNHLMIFDCQDSTSCSNGQSMVSTIITKKPSFVFSENFDKVETAMKRALHGVISCSNYGLSSSRAIMLYGKPGTGKSEIVKSLLSEMKNRDRKYIINSPVFISPRAVLSAKSVKDLLDHTAINNSSQNITFVVCDDCDIWLGDRKQLNTTNDKSVDTVKYMATSEMMEILSKGIPNQKYIFIFTTNYIDKMDPALLRNGRIDAKIEITDINQDTASRMCRAFDTDPSVILKDEEFPINPAYLQTKILNSKNI